MDCAVARGSRSKTNIADGSYQNCLPGFCPKSENSDFGFLPPSLFRRDSSDRWLLETQSSGDSSVPGGKWQPQRSGGWVAAELASGWGICAAHGNKAEFRISARDGFGARRNANEPGA